MDRPVRVSVETPELGRLGADRVERSRIALLGGAAAFTVLQALGREVGAAPSLPEVTVYKSPT